MDNNRQEDWNGLLSPPPGDLPNPGIEPRSPALQADSLPSEPPGKPWWSKEHWGMCIFTKYDFLLYIFRGLQLFKRHRWKTAQENAYRSKDMWNMELWFHHPGCHGQLCVPSTDVQAVSTCRQGSSLQAPCPECLLGLHCQGMTDGPYSWSQAQSSLEVQLILHDQNPHPESHHSCGPNFLL